MNFVVVAPGGGATGGVELLHQLVHELRFLGAKATIAYYAFRKSYGTPDGYLKYNAPVCNPCGFDELDLPENVIVLPEVYTYLVRKVRRARVVVWWMSVDNYLNSRRVLYALPNGFLPFTYLRPSDFRAVSMHLTQSEYARRYLARFGVRDLLPLGDFINEDYLGVPDGGGERTSQNIVVYNPAKGRQVTLKVEEWVSAVRPEIRFIPIAGMSRRQVIELLGAAKVYIDFGNHPGKDRLPREAAACGCCIITGRSGSAANEIDVPIPTDYKFDERESDFVGRAGDAIIRVIDEFASHSVRFEPYRAVIRGERMEFRASVREFVRCLEEASA